MNVSVPSTGRSGLQPRPLSHAIMYMSRFSTLYGSKWVATRGLRRALKVHRRVSVPSTGRSGLQLKLASGLLASKTFQYPLRVEVGCNRTGVRSRTGTPKFQYPLRVEVGCNAVSLLVAFIAVRFSTLYGSKWVATLCTASTKAHCGKFQYPLRVEVGCNAVSDTSADH